MVLQLAKRGAHVVVADLNQQAAEDAAQEAAQLPSSEMVLAFAMNLGPRASNRDALKAPVLQFCRLGAALILAARVGNLPGAGHQAERDYDHRPTDQPHLHRSLPFASRGDAVAIRPGVSAAGSAGV